MKIDSMLSEFVESYGREAIDSIDAMRNDYGRTYKKHTIELTNIDESCKMFAKWLGGCTKYCVEETQQGNTLNSNIITESFNNFMNTILKPRPYSYPEIPTFVTGYTEGVKTIIETVNTSKAMMTENDVDQSLIESIDSCTDRFSDALLEAFTPGMDKLLWASGYNSRRAIFGPREPKREKPPVFV